MTSPPGGHSSPSPSSTSSQKRHPIWQQLAIGGTSVIPAIILTHPLDIVKLRQQIHGFKGLGTPLYANAFSGIYRIIRHEGMVELFSGISPAIVRAYTFSATRLGLYEPLRDSISQLFGTKEPTFSVKICAALSSGTLATFVGNPFELLKVRMQGGDYMYRNVFHGINEIYKKEGIITLWNGTPAAIIRASLFSASQLATYDHTKHLLTKHTSLHGGTRLNFGAAMIAGLVTTTISTPADFIKSVMMNSTASRKPSIGAIIVSVVKRDGGATFFRGWFANYARLGPHTVITMLTLEKLRKLIGWDTI